MIHQQQVIAILEPGMGQEKGHIFNEDAPHMGDGLDKAVKQALSNHDNIAINAIFSSMNGERYWSKEHGVAMIRNKHFMSEEVEIHHPADCFGDLGAATGPVLTALATKHLWNRSDQMIRYLCTVHRKVLIALRYVLEKYKQQLNTIYEGANGCLN